MIESALAFFPMLACFFWSIMLVLQLKRSKSKTPLLALFIMTSISLFADAFRFSVMQTIVEYKVFVIADILYQFSSLLVPSLIIFTLSSLRGRRISCKWRYAAVQPAICQGVACLVIFGLIGLNDAASFIQAYDIAGYSIPALYDSVLFKAQYRISLGGISALLAIEFVICTAYLIYIIIKEKDKRFRWICVMLGMLIFFCATRLALGRAFLLSQVLLSSVFSVLITIDVLLVAYMCLEMHNSNQDTSAAPSPDRVSSYSQNIVPTNVEAVAKPFIEQKPSVQDDLSIWHNPAMVPISKKDTNEDKLKSEAKLVFESEPDSGALRTASNLVESFVIYMSKDSPYLDPDFSVMDVCNALHTNRTYISELMAEYFKMPFRDYVGVLRISVSKRLLRDDPNRTLENIAADSGFASSSQFVKKFKEVTGTTPRAWLTGRS